LYAEAEAHFRAAVARLTERNANPYDGEPSYHLGLALKFQLRFDAAYAAFYKAAWNYAWRAAAFTQLGAIDCARGDWEQALEHFDLALETAAGSLLARGLKTAVLRRTGRGEEALAVARETHALDPLDFLALNELALLGEADTAAPRPAAEAQLDVALDYAAAGLREEAAAVLASAPGEMAGYARAFFGASPEPIGPADRLFPSRLEEIAILEHALARNPADAQAHSALGNLLYDKQRREEAIAHWEAAAAADPARAGVWRNLGVAHFNVRHDAPQALACYERALAAAGGDARILYEYDLLRKRTHAQPGARLAFLETRRNLVDSRDDLAVERATLLNLLGRHEEALAYLASRRFHPWEGGEGLVSAQYVNAHYELGRAALRKGRAAEARGHFDAARNYPQNLGEGKRLLASEARLDYAEGLAWAQDNEEGKARECWRRAAPESESFGSGDAEAALRAFQDAAYEQPGQGAQIDYFATSRPDFLVFGG
jgi:tetratricopeptide (TPR) repeat protein